MTNSNGGGEGYRGLPYFLAVAISVAYRAILPATILDDAYITMRVARNISLGNGAVFNLGQRVYAITNPLWTLLNALPRTLGLDSVAIIWVLGALSEILLAVIIVRLTYSLVKSRWAGVLAVAIFFANPVFLISSHGGMEIALSMAAIALAFLFVNENKPTAALLTAFVGVWVRFDNLLLLGVVFIALLFRKETKLRFKHLLPSALIVGALLAVTWAYYGTPIPVSVIRKVALDKSATWSGGALKVLGSFAMAFIGQSRVYRLGNALNYLMPLFFLLGMYSIISDKIKRFWPLGLFAIMYILAFVISGNEYAVLFSWYFVPPLLLTSIFAGVGLKKLLAELPLQFEKKAIIYATLAIIWTAALLPFNLADSREYRDDISAVREQIYAAATIWFEENIEGDFKIAAGEIGAIGFFADDGTEIVDMVGLTRPIEDKRQPVNLIAEEYVEGIIYWLPENLDFPKIQAVYPNYEFGQVERTVIGLRSDIAEEILVDSPRLMEIYNTVDMNREYRY